MNTFKVTALAFLVALFGLRFIPTAKAQEANSAPAESSKYSFRNFELNHLGVIEKAQLDASGQLAKISFGGPDGLEIEINRLLGIPLSASYLSITRGPITIYGLELVKLMKVIYQKVGEAQRSPETSVQVRDSLSRFANAELNLLDEVTKVKFDKSGRIAQVDFLFGGDGISIHITRIGGMPIKAEYESLSRGRVSVMGRDLSHLMAYLEQKVGSRGSAQANACARSLSR